MEHCCGLFFTSNYLVNEADANNSTIIFYIPLRYHSAGVGRTGCFVATETALDMLKHEKKIDMIAIIKEMRNQRGLLVQNSVKFLVFLLIINIIVEIM